jgi:hypothetical protein
VDGARREAAAGGGWKRHAVPWRAIGRGREVDGIRAKSAVTTYNCIKQFTWKPAQYSESINRMLPDDEPDDELDEEDEEDEEDELAHELEDDKADDEDDLDDDDLIDDDDLDDDEDDDDEPTS